MITEQIRCVYQEGATPEQIAASFGLREQVVKDFLLTKSPTTRKFAAARLREEYNALPKEKSYYALD